MTDTCIARTWHRRWLAATIAALAVAAANAAVVLAAFVAGEAPSSLAVAAWLCCLSSGIHGLTRVYYWRFEEGLCQLHRTTNG